MGGEQSVYVGQVSELVSVRNALSYFMPVGLRTFRTDPLVLEGEEDSANRAGPLSLGLRLVEGHPASDFGRVVGW